MQDAVTHFPHKKTREELPALLEGKSPHHRQSKRLLLSVYNEGILPPSLHFWFGISLAYVSMNLSKRAVSAE